MVEVRRFGARFNLLRTLIHGRPPGQRRPPQLSLMHQDIHWMFLVHEICFFFLFLLLRARQSAAVAHTRARSLAVNHHSQSDVAGCRGRVDRLGSVRGTHSGDGSFIGESESAR